MFELIRDGGVAMWPLVLGSILGVAVVLDRALYLLHARCDRAALVDQVAAALRDGGLEAALEVAGGYRGPVARVVRHALSGAVGGDHELAASLERMKALQQSLLERRLFVLATIAAVTPFVGLFGTVIGIQRAFADIAATGQAGIAIVGKGVSEALIATAAGLGIAIVAVIAYNLFGHLVDQVSLEMDLAADEVVSLLQAAGS